MSENFRDDKWISGFIQNQVGTIEERVDDLMTIIADAFADKKLHDRGASGCMWKDSSSAAIAIAYALGAIRALQREREIKGDV